MTMIPTIAFTILFALWCSRDDANQIARHSKIRHGIQWTIRAAVVLAVCYLSGTWWLAIGMAGLFSAVFRWDLNGRRGLDWRCIGPWSSIYDCAWLTLQVHIEAKAWHPRKWSWPKRWHLDAFKAFYIERSPSMTYSIHRAGTMAYIFEGVVFVVVLYLYWRSKA